ncbi:MAG: type VI secretion system tip protein VgrG [Bacteroidetes bacterium]|nr:type VI secretion system tip protein VgrG [Bacteroidota bacterium]
MARASELIINIDGKDITGYTHLSIHQEVYNHNTFELVCRPDTLEKFSDTGDIFVFRKADALIGKKIKIQIGGGNKTLPLFKGIIMEVEGSQQHDAWSGNIVFRGNSFDVLMDGEHKSRFFEKTSQSSILNKLKGESISGNLFDGVKFSPQYTGSIPLVTQYNETDYELLRRLAKKYGEWLLVTNDNTLYFGEAPDKSVSLTHGEDLQEFSFSMKINHLQLKYTGYDPAKQEMMTGKFDPGSVQAEAYLSKSVKASNNSYGGSESFYYNDSFDTDNLTARAKAEGSGRISGLNTARGTSDNPELSVGCKVKLTTGGESLEYRVISIYHSCDEGGNYLNHFVAIPAYLKVPPTVYPNPFPTCETQSAVVTSVTDAEKLGRIKVKFYWNDQEVESPWLRVVTPYSGNKKGFYFIPEVGQEVLIGFENGNPDRPYVMGSHYNGKNKAEDWVDDHNYKKAIRTDSGHTIEFNDEGGKEQIIIYDKDKVNTITLNTHDKILSIETTGDLKIKAQNIEIKAEKDFKLDVTGKIDIKSQDETQLHATGNCTIKSDQDTKMEGMNLKVEGQMKAELKGMQLTAKGEMTAEFSSGAQTTVKGGIVMIN